VIPGSGHVFDGLTGVGTCLDPFVVRFLDTADAKALDTRCVATMRRPSFVMSEESYFHRPLGLVGVGLLSVKRWRANA
jgi:hypothetical protein